MDLNDIGVDYQAQITTQQYGGAPRIAGVKIVDLRLLQDDGGSFAELIRLNEQGYLEAFPEFQVRQSSYSLILPGAVKAFHLHFGQDDVWFVLPTDRLLVGLFDAREAAESYQTSMRLALGGGKAQLVFIPRGVAHGCANLSGQNATIIYYVNQQFNLNNPDERRLPWDILGKEFWQMTPG